ACAPFIVNGRRLASCLLRLLRATGLNESLARGVAGDGDVRRGVVLLADRRAALRNPNLYARRTVARRDVAHVVAVRVERPTARRDFLTAGAERGRAAGHRNA